MNANDVTQRLAEILGLPANTISATLKLEWNTQPVLTVVRVLGGLGDTREDRFRLVPFESDGVPDVEAEHKSAWLRQVSYRLGFEELPADLAPFADELYAQGFLANRAFISLSAMLNTKIGGT